MRLHATLDDRVLHNVQLTSVDLFLTQLKDSIVKWVIEINLKIKNKKNYLFLDEFIFENKDCFKDDIDFSSLYTSTTIVTRKLGNVKNVYKARCEKLVKYLLERGGN